MSSSDQEKKKWKLQTIETSVNYLRAAAAVHWRTPATAFAELVDNGKDAGATQVKIGVVKLGSQEALSFRDDGKGMDEKGLDRMFGFGFSGDALTVSGGIGEYGAGFKSGSMKLGMNALVLTKHRQSGSMHAALLSRALHEDHEMEGMRLPMLTFIKKDGGIEVDYSKPGAKTSLGLILKYSRVVTNEGVLKGLIQKLKFGTRIIISQLNKNIKLEADDIKFEVPWKNVEESSEESEGNRGDRNASASSALLRRQTKYWKHDHSLRAYLAYVYGKITPSSENKNPAIYIRNVRVEPVTWTDTLYHMGTDIFRGSRTKFGIEDLGDIKLYMGFTKHLRQRPGAPYNLLPHPDNEPQGVVSLVNGRAVQLFELLKSQANQGGKSWKKYTSLQSRGHGARLVCELNVTSASKLQLMQNKDGFQSNLELSKLMAHLDTRLKRYCKAAQERYFEVKCNGKRCNHSNFGKPGYFLWNENPVYGHTGYFKRRTRKEPFDISEDERARFRCTACRGGYHDTSFKVNEKTVLCTCRGEYSADESDVMDLDFNTRAKAEVVDYNNVEDRIIPQPARVRKTEGTSRRRSKARRAPKKRKRRRRSSISPFRTIGKGEEERQSERKKGRRGERWRER